MNLAKTAVAETAMAWRPEQTLASENRAIHRIPVRLVVSHRGRSAPLGVTRDLSLQGAFIETHHPLEAGTVVPLAIELAPSSTVEVRGEVVRVTPEGMGLRFADLGREAGRALRRWVVDQTSVAGSRRQVEQLHGPGASVEPVRDRSRIVHLLEEVRRGRQQLTCIPIERTARDYGRLVEVDATQLVMESSDPSTLIRGEEIYVLTTIAFVSYAFGVRVREVAGTRVCCDLPTTLVFSERRTRRRRSAPVGAALVWPDPAASADEVALPVLDISDDGLSFRAPAQSMLVPGTPLPAARLRIDNHDQELENAEVRNLARVEDESGPWIRVGVVHGRSRIGRADLVASAPRVGRSAVARWLTRARDALSVLLHRGRARLIEPPTTAKRVVVRAGELPIVGRLEATFDLNARSPAPLVIVIPGFAGRKEQFSFFAGTLLEAFGRNNADVGVLRIDGTNNLGESGRAQGAQGEGLACLNYTVSGVVDDTLAALAWARSNPYIEPTHIIVVSVSMASIGVRRVMTMPEAADVAMWVSYMGAPDAVDAIRNVSGNIDFHAIFAEGRPVGVVSLAGVLCDGDHFWRDLRDHNMGDLDAARDEMSRVKADVVWLRGRYDAYMDPRRVAALMDVPARGARELIEVQSGHLPRTGEEAIEQFVALSRRIWRYVHKSPLPPFRPSLGALAVRMESEWKDVRREPIVDRAKWWRDYLLDNEGVGFDILEFSPAYEQLMADQARLLLGGPVDPLRRPRILELGAGTGNLSRRLLAQGVELVATDLVPDALKALHAKVGVDDAEHLRVMTVDLDGSPLQAMRRLQRGDLHGVQALAGRVPGVQRHLLDELVSHASDALHATLTGRTVDAAKVGSALRVSPQAQRLLNDLNVLGRVAAGRISADQARALSSLTAAALDDSKGIPLPDQSVDGIAMSLVLSYLDHPEDALAEAYRVLRPGGRFVLSSLVRDSESSALYLDLLQRLETLPDEDLPASQDPAAMRAHLVDSARRFVDHASELFRLEEEGLFRFWDGDELAELVRRRGFDDVEVFGSFGHPAQAVIVRCVRR